MLMKILRKILPGWAKRRIRGVLGKVGALVTEGALAAQNDTLTLLDQKIERVRHELLERQDEVFRLLEQDLKNELEARLQAPEDEARSTIQVLDGRVNESCMSESTFISLYEACIGDTSDPVVCELLTGEGDFLAWLGERGLVGFGCETRPDLFRKARARGLQVEFREPRDFLAGQKGGGCDTIVLRRGVDRMSEDVRQAVMQEALRVLRDGGRAVLRVTNQCDMALASDQSCEDGASAIEVHETELRRLMNGTGFSNVRVVRLNDAGAERTGEVPGSVDVHGRARGDSLNGTQQAEGSGGSPHQEDRGKTAWVVAIK